MSSVTLEKNAVSLSAPVADRMDVVRFLAISVQFVLLVLVIRAFELVSPNFGNLMVLALGGFVVHHFLPRRLQMPWFVLVSLWGLKLVAGGTVAVWVTACGLALIGICHLPAAFSVRVALLLAAAVVISLLRVGQIAAPVNVAAWIVLGSMFMFRTMSYLYELRHQTAPFGLVRAMAYFFMIPNVCFVLFPLVDYRTFNSSHFNDRWERIYGKGLQWMLRGVVHLLLYRLIYQLALIDPLEATDLLSVVQFMLATYLLYLRVSGWFHLIVGLLHMYGFNLPETHHLYLLASSFTDFWRRINIYWKDFLLKVFFYPAYFRLKWLGPKWAMGLATLFAFFVTWLLHSYQFFWIRGEWLLTWQDSLFWGLLALLVLVNALWELRAGAKRPAAAGRTWKTDAGVALRTIATFVVICCLWTLWSCKSWEELAWLATAATNAPLHQLAAVVIGLAMLGLAGVWLGQSPAASGAPIAPRRQSPSLWRSVSVSVAGAVVLIVIELMPESLLPDDPAIREPLLAIRFEQLNRADLADKRRGYYEELDVSRAGRNLRFLQSRTESDPWFGAYASVRRDTSDFLLYDVLPLQAAEYLGGTLSTNQWGMRDKEYSKEKPAGVTRIALLGSSHEFGFRVSDEQVFEVIAENRLNSEPTASSRYEMLNFSVPGDTMLSHLRRLETEVVEFRPDFVFRMTCAPDPDKILSHLTNVMSRNYDVPYAFLTNGARESKITGGKSDSQSSARLSSKKQTIFAWAVSEAARISQQSGSVFVLVFRPSPSARAGLERERERQFFAYARGVASNAAVPVLDLTAAFDNSPLSLNLCVSAWDDHTNAKGHKLLADELYRKLKSTEGQQLLRGAAPPRQARQASDAASRN